MLVMEPRTALELYDVHDDPGSRYCHIVGDDGGWLCGGRSAPGPGEPWPRTHSVMDPGRPACVGCGRLRCPECAEIWKREEA